jgi:hypothetical protein
MNLPRTPSVSCLVVVPGPESLARKEVTVDSEPSSGRDYPWLARAPPVRPHPSRLLGTCRIINHDIRTLQQTRAPNNESNENKRASETLRLMRARTTQNARPHVTNHERTAPCKNQATVEQKLRLPALERGSSGLGRGALANRATIACCKSNTRTSI